jgi:hypothetical protein
VTPNTKKPEEILSEHLAQPSGEETQNQMTEFRRSAEKLRGTLMRLLIDEGVTPTFATSFAERKVDELAKGYSVDVTGPRR